MSSLTVAMAGLSVGLLLLMPASAYGLRSIQAQDSPALAEAVAAGMEEEPQLSPGPLKLKYIRLMVNAWDMPEVLAIEQSVEQPDGAAPWLKKDFQRAAGQKKTIRMVAEFKDKVVGFMVYKLHKKEIQLLKLAVHPDYRDHDVGTALVEKLVTRLSSLRYTRIVMDIPEAHLGSRLFLKKMGFQEVPWSEGLYRFVYRLPGTDEPPEDLLAGKPEAAGDGSSAKASDAARVSGASDPQGLPMDLLVAQILERSRGKFVLKGALDILKGLEFIVSSSKEELPFTRWGDAYALLSQAARQFELGEVSKILPLLADSDRRDPREELARFFESFRSSHQGEHTYEVLDPLRRGETEARAPGPSTIPPQEGSSGLGTGLEETSPEAILDRLEGSAQGAGAVVLEADLLRGRAGLGEFAARVGEGVGRRLVIVGLEESEAKVLHARNRSIHLAPAGDPISLAVLLTGLEEADRITHIGETPELAEQLDRILPASMEVIHLDAPAGLEQIFLALGAGPIPLFKRSMQPAWRSA